MTEYRRYQGKSYMICTEELELCGYEYPMLINNEICGFIPFRIANSDEKIQFWYEISGLHSLENWAKIKKLNGKFLKNFIGTLKKSIENIGEYLLKEDGISLFPERIFVDAAEETIWFCYMPFEKTAFETSLKSFMEYYLSHMEHGNGIEVQKCYDAYEMCQKEHIKLDELLQIFLEETNEEPVAEESEKLDEMIEKKIENKEKKHSFFANVKTIKNYIKKREEPETPYVFHPIEEEKESMNPTIFLGSESEEILGELRYEGEENQENFKIFTSQFLIGNQIDEVDGCIRDETVSRLHAKIMVENGQYYLEDLNSTNGTYINGKLLEYMERIKLEKNDKITFAKEMYRFV